MISHRCSRQDAVPLAFSTKRFFCQFDCSNLLPSAIVQVDVWIDPLAILLLSLARLLRRVLFTPSYGNELTASGMITWFQWS